MNVFTKQNVVTLAVIFGAIIFGMVLAGGLGLTPKGQTSPEPSPAAASIAGQSAAGLPSFADLAEQVSPAVVTIEASTFERTRGGRMSDPFEFFFGPRRREQQDRPEDEDEEFRSDSGGSGFVVSADGLVVTNNHVIRGAEQVRVRIGNTAYDAEVKGIDAATDLALLKIDAGDDLPFLPLGDSDDLRPGDWVMAIGSPLELANTVTVGVVSAKGRRINISPETTSFESFIPTDAAINFGNSGGPLVNLSGLVVGINTAINWGSENIGFAVPVNILRQVLPQLRDAGRVRRGYLGIGVNDVTDRAAEAFGLESTEGALVSNVIPGLPADQGGLQAGDIILTVDGQTIENTRELIDYVSNQGPEAKVELGILREGKRMKKTIQLAERPSESGEPEEDEGPEDAGIEWLGLRYQDISPGLRSNHGIPEDVEGVWVTDISPRSPLYEEGVRSGELINIITKVNERSVGSVAEFEELVRDAQSGSRLIFYLRRFGRGQELQPLFVFPAVP
ncbi:MAG: Do family serine endopeptidase [Thermoanaerobaculia bacterium]